MVFSEKRTPESQSLQKKMNAEGDIGVFSANEKRFWARKDTYIPWGEHAALKGLSTPCELSKTKKTNHKQTGAKNQQPDGRLANISEAAGCILPKMKTREKKT